MTNQQASQFEDHVYFTLRRDKVYLGYQSVLARHTVPNLSSRRITLFSAFNDPKKIFNIAFLSKLVCLHIVTIATSFKVLMVALIVVMV